MNFRPREVNQRNELEACLLNVFDEGWDKGVPLHQDNMFKEMLHEMLMWDIPNVTEVVEQFLHDAEVRNIMDARNA